MPFAFESDYLNFAFEHYNRHPYEATLSGFPGVMMKGLNINFDDVVGLDWPQNHVECVGQIAKRFALKPEQVTPALGTHGANLIVALALLKPGDEVLGEFPVYDPMIKVFAFQNCPVNYFERRAEDAFRVKPELVEKALTPKTKLIVVTNLHNPTGVGINADELKALQAIADKRGIHVLVDEVYLDFLFEKPQPRAPHFGGRLISTGSTTKIFGISNPRCGWILANEEITRACRAAVQAGIGYPPVPAMNISIAVMKQYDDRLKTARAEWSTRDEITRRWLASEKRLKPAKPDGGLTWWLELPRGLSGMKLWEHCLREYQTCITPGNFFGSDAHIRLSIGNEPEQLAPTLERITSALNDLI